MDYVDTLKRLLAEEVVKQAEADKQRALENQRNYDQYGMLAIAGLLAVVAWQRWKS